jgi:hypothetical protein
MKNTFKYLVSSALLVGSFSAIASCEKLSCEGVTNTVVSGITSNEIGTYVNFPFGTNSALDCALYDENAALLDSAHKEFKSIHSLLLTALASNLPIEITFKQNEANCSISSVSLKVTQ